jgi:hypothetical protein
LGLRSEVSRLGGKLLRHGTVRASLTLEERSVPMGIVAARGKNQSTNSQLTLDFRRDIAANPARTRVGMLVNVPR